MARKTSSKSHSSKRPAGTGSGKPRFYTLEVFLTEGCITEQFARQNPHISRTIQIRGAQTLEDLHYAIFQAFDRFDEHLYEFQFGKGPMDPKGPRYRGPYGYEGDARVGRTDLTTIDSLGLKKGRSFGYWFDFGDDWRHQIDVEAVDETTSPGKYPRVIKQVGKSPPQYPDGDEE